MSTWLSPRLGTLQPKVDYEMRGYWDADAEDQAGEMDLSAHELTVSTPLTQSDRFEWALFAHVGAWDIHTNTRLPDTSEDFPSHLWDVGIGTGFRQKLDNEWIWGAAVSVGSPSDEPFASADELSLRASAFLRIGHGDRNAWVLLADLSNTRTFLEYVPLPGGGYLWNPNDRLRVFAGVPFSSLYYEPVEWLEIEASYGLIRNVHAKVTVRPVQPVGLYVGFDWDHKAWFRHDRADEDDRLYYYDKRVSAGVRWDITPSAYVDLSGGYAFDRRWFEGEDYDDRDQNRIELDEGWFAGIAAGIRF